MKPNPTRSALLLIDMENGFVHPRGRPLHPRRPGHGPRLRSRAVDLARAKGIPVSLSSSGSTAPTAATWS